MKKKLPAGWVETDLQNILVSLENGSRPKGGVADILEGIPSLGGEHLTYNHKFSIGNMRYVPTEFAQKMNQGIIQQNDCLIVKDGATTGKTCFVGADFPFQKAVVNEHVFIARTSKTDFESKFLYYFLWSVLGQNQIKANITGTAQGGINQKFAKNVIIPIPPLAEQKRIVSELNAVFAHVHAAQAELAKMPALIKMFRQKVLAMAVSGDLTRDFRANTPILETAEALLARIKAEHRKVKFKKKEFDTILNQPVAIVPDSWCLECIGNIEQFIGSGVTPSGGHSNYLKEGEIMFIRSQNVYPNGLRLEEVAYISEDLHNSMLRTHLKPNDVLLNITGASIGRTTIVPIDFGQGNVNQHVCILRLQFINPSFLMLFLNSPSCQNWIDDQQKGMTRQGLNYGQIRALKLPIPPLTEQAEIVKRVSELFTWCDAMESAYQEGVANLKILPQSLLQRAFSGGLVAQNTADEPASTLLERIQAAKTPPKAAKKQSMAKTRLATVAKTPKKQKETLF